MWCAVHVKDGGEAKAEAFMSGLFRDSLYVRCFHLTRSRRKKYGGQWKTIRESLLPGYVFIDTNQPEAVHRELEKAPGKKLLFSDGANVSTLREPEVAFLKSIIDEDGEIGLSEVSVGTDGEIRVLSGPLANVGQLVRKVNLHKRIAEVEADFMGRQAMYFGIEIVGGSEGRSRAEAAS